MFQSYSINIHLNQNYFTSFRELFVREILSNITNLPSNITAKNSDVPIGIIIKKKCIHGLKLFLKTMWIAG